MAPMTQIVDGLISDVEKENELENVLSEVVDDMQDGDEGRSKFLEGAFWTIALQFLRTLLDNCGEGRLKRGLRRSKRNSRRRAFLQRKLQNRLSEDETMAQEASSFSNSLMNVGEDMDEEDWVRLR